MGVIAPSVSIYIVGFENSLKFGLKRQVTQRRKSEVFDVGEPTMVETKMHVSPDMVSEDMKNWTPDDWTKHLEEMCLSEVQQGNEEAPELATMVLQFFTDHSEDCKSKKSQRNRKPKKESVTTSFRDTSEDNNQNENDSPKPVQRQGSYSGSFNEAKKGFTNMAERLERLEKKNGNGGGGSPDFVVPKLKPV